ncbi:GTP 3',8-cyclase MoaA [Thermithiobacillus plumbiphilus]|uniref:GTP 3',8-cyclase n=1 Tax=Thermithiobacillus plumbiphilus TaxID=1729899 RepID=A0ABU9D4T1_9PROT
MSERAMLVDGFGRRIEYLRLSVTDRCDLRCTYCIPEGFKDFEEPDHWLNFDEIEQLVGAFVRLGVNKIRLTGGEPLLRRNLTELVARLAALPGIGDLSLSTNATQLAKHAAELKALGLNRINVSLDSLDPGKLQRIAGRDCLGKVLSGLMAAKAAGFAQIKINTVVMRGVNDDEIDALLAFCWGHGFTLRLIETMPMGDTGRNAQYVDLQPIRQRLRTQYGLIEGLVAGGGPAQYLTSPDGAFSVGFITPISQHFCTSCNRIRLTVDGTLYLCLGQDEKFEFRTLLRAGALQSDLERHIREAIALKPERHEFKESPHKIIRVMAKTGG